MTLALGHIAPIAAGHAATGPVGGLEPLYRRYHEALDLWQDRTAKGESMSVRNWPGRRLPVLSVAAGTALLMLMPAGPAASASTLATHGSTAGAGESPAAQNVPVSAAERSLLEQLYASYRGISRSDIASIRKFSVRGAYVASTRTQWATASFIPSLRDRVPVVAGF